MALMKEIGGECRFVGGVPDDYQRTKELLLHVSKQYDVVFTTGGVSVGEHDYVAEIIADAGELVFHRVAIRPGKPLAVGVVNNTPVFALPSKPTGAFAALEMMVRRYFTDIPRAVQQLEIGEDIVFQERGFKYILFVKKMTGSMVYAKSNKEYDASIISASPRSAVVDGYVVTERNLRKGEMVEVYLFN